MKNRITFIVLLLFISFGIRAQNTNGTSDSIANLLCKKKWVLEYIEKKDIKIFPTAQSGNDYFQFNTDNTLTLTNNAYDSQEKKATWKYDSEKRVIKIKRPRSSNKYSRVIRLTEKELIIEEDVEGMKLSGEVPLIYHFKPVSN